MLMHSFLNLSDPECSTQEMCLEVDQAQFIYTLQQQNMEQGSLCCAEEETHLTVMCPLSTDLRMYRLTASLQLQALI